jgi:hypothetical protein
MSAIETAILIWQEGEPIPMDLAVELMAEGYDVEALEEQYMS